MLDSYFPGVFDGLYCTNEHSCTGGKTTKADIMDEHGMLLLIDDNRGYCANVCARGKKAVLFGDYPWNQGEDIDGRMRAETWGSVPMMVSSLL